MAAEIVVYMQRGASARLYMQLTCLPLHVPTMLDPAVRVSAPTHCFRPSSGVRVDTLFVKQPNC